MTDANYTRGREETVLHTFDPAEESVATSVAIALSEAVDEAPCELTPLQTTIDGDVVDALFDGAAAAGSEVRLEFEHEGCVVTVSSGGEITVHSRATVEN